MIFKHQRVIRTAADLRIEIDRHIPRIKAISIDIFNTVLERDTVRIEDYQKMLARRIVRTLTDNFDIDRTVEDVIELITKIENVPEHPVTNAKPLNPYRFNSFAKALANDLINNDHIQIAALTERINAHMLAVETEAFFVRLDMATILEWINHQNIRLIAISDMPFDPGHLQNILKRQGLAVHVERIYTYPEPDTVNQSKQFFESLLQQEGILPQELIHICSYRPSNCRLTIWGKWWHVWTTDDFDCLVTDFHQQLVLLQQQLGEKEQLQAEIMQLRSTISEMSDSRSWKLTAPIRFLVGQ